MVDGEHFGLTMNAARARLLCDRHRGVGSDGVLVGDAASSDADIAVRIFNPDGSEAEKSGNGVRTSSRPTVSIAGSARPAAYASRRWAASSQRSSANVAPRSPFSVSRWASSALPRCVRCRCWTPTAACRASNDTWVERALTIGGRSVTATCVSVGNPHAVLLSAPCDEATLLDLGLKVERHAQFPQRTNVQLCEVLDRGRVRALIWERGAGATLASGSSACAVVAACARAGHLDLDRDIEVVMPGGSLSVRLGTDGAIEQTGPVEAICEGLVAGDLWNALVRA